jgi:hypothetical protein
MSMRARLARLELGVGRCPLCRDRPSEVALRIVECVIEDYEDGAALGPDPGPPPELAPCRRCGWKPRVVEIVEESSSSSANVEDQSERGLGEPDDGSA